MENKTESKIRNIIDSVAIFDDKTQVDSIKNSERLSVRKLAHDEKTRHLEHIKAVLADKIKPSGRGYLDSWESGWSQNLDMFDHSPSRKALVPKYIRQNLPVRLNNDLFLPISQDFELNLLGKIKRVLFKDYLSECSDILELGCGTGHHLIDCAGLLGGAVQLFGLDWSKASNRLVDRVAIEYQLNLKAVNFDFFDPGLPDTVMGGFGSKIGIFSIGALEQIGSEWERLLEFLLQLRPSVVIHLEPTIEFYDSQVELDSLALRFHRKKKWLSGYRTELERLQDCGKIELLASARTFGSYMHEAYGVTVWAPKG